MRKAKADGSESVTVSEEGQNEEFLPGGSSVLEISGPTIPSPGPSGSKKKQQKTLSLHLQQQKQSERFTIRIFFCAF